MNVIIYGAGEAGVQIAQYCKGTSTYSLVAFIDDNPDLHGENIDGIEVYSSDKISELIHYFDVKEIFIAIPSAQRKRYQSILRNLSSHHVHLRTLPKLEEISDGKVTMIDVKEINIEDLLLRDPVKPLPDVLVRNVENKVVLVTGAGGSIGSELCRQIFALNPKHIILVDHSEFNLYSISTELHTLLIANRFSPIISSVLSSVTDEQEIRSVVKKFRPNTIFHAAAYKHVSMVENNIAAGIKNNIYGTLYVAKASLDYGVKNFTLISTDKAVRPSSIMGMTKRVAEMILQSFSTSSFQKEEANKTCFSIVRFGNVLGSSGSVVPLFREQIRRGGPITVTHPNATRYFMTIGEAAQLVIQASSLAVGGDLFLLDMGEPVRIYDLAKHMIELSGNTIKTHDSDEVGIEIIFTGLARGEKVHEEILISGSPKPTIHPKILMANEKCTPCEELEALLLESRSLMFDASMLESLLKKIISRNAGQQNNT